MGIFQYCKDANEMGLVRFTTAVDPNLDLIQNSCSLPCGCQRTPITCLPEGSNLKRAIISFKAQLSVRSGFFSVGSITKDQCSLSV